MGLSLSLHFVAMNDSKRKVHLCKVTKLDIEAVNVLDNSFFVAAQGLRDHSNLSVD